MCKKSARGNCIEKKGIGANIVLYWEESGRGECIGGRVVLLYVLIMVCRDADG